MIGTRIAGVAAVALAVLTGCEYAGPADNAVARSLTWLSRIGGEDIEKACTAGAEERYRFFYNGTYDKQLRTYDVHLLPGGRGAALDVYVRSELDLTEERPILELGSAWAGTTVQSTLSVQGMSELRSALEEDGFTRFKPVGLRMPSDEFYWIAVGCVDGRFHVNAWIYPTERFNALKFPAVLLDHDRTGIALYVARPEGDRDPPLANYGRFAGHNGRFNLQLGPNGLVDSKGLF